MGHGRLDRVRGRPVAPALQRAVDLGCNFFDTAWGYGEGRSERLLGQLVRANPGQRLYTATKIPPKNWQWPSRRGCPAGGCFPPDHIREYAEKSLANLGLPSVDLIQFHVWEDAWADDERWQRAMDDLKREGLVRGVGISVNRWEPCERRCDTLRTGMIDERPGHLQHLRPGPGGRAVPRSAATMDVGVIARVPFDEGTLTGTLTKESRWPEGDWRNSYFVPENLEASVERAERAAAAGARRA